MHCPACEKDSPCWQSSGMSQCSPHFYCDRCSNALHRCDDYFRTYSGVTPALLEDIRHTLPSCPCGGRFTPEANPKCIHCGSEFPLNPNPLDRLKDPHVIILDGALFLSDEREPHRVCIDAEGTHDGKKIVPCDACGTRFRVPCVSKSLIATCPSCRGRIRIDFSTFSYETEIQNA